MTSRICLYQPVKIANGLGFQTAMSVQDRANELYGDGFSVIIQSSDDGYDVYVKPVSIMRKYIDNPDDWYMQLGK